MSWIEIGDNLRGKIVQRRHQDPQVLSELAIAFGNVSHSYWLRREIVECDDHW